MSPWLLGLSLAFQFGMALLFFQEAVYTNRGHFCRLKCTIAGIFYVTAAVMLILAFFEIKLLFGRTP